MVNDILRVVLLGEVHEDVVPVKTLERLFGSEGVDEFKARYPEVVFEDGYVGRGSRVEAKRRRTVIPIMTLPRDMAVSMMMKPALQGTMPQLKERPIIAGRLIRFPWSSMREKPWSCPCSSSP